MRSAKKLLVGTLGTALAITGLTALAPTPAHAQSTGLIINEVYGGGGGTSTAAYSRADFVELYNPTDGPLSTNGLSLQYRSSSYSGAAHTPLPLPDATVPAHSHYLVQVSAGTVGNELPVTPDFTAPSPGPTLNMAQGSGQVILASGATAITTTGTSMHTVTNVVDFVGYGTATSSETSATGVALTNATSTQRGDFVDDDNNQTDYAAPATPSPESSGPAAPTPVEAAPRDDVHVNVGMAFPNITLQASGGTPPLSWSATGLPPGVTLATDGALTGTPTTEGTYPVTATVTDAADPATTDDVTFTITVAEELTLRPIAEIQGTGPRSPFAPAAGNSTGDATVLTEGVVTAMYRTGGFNGMYVQTAGTGGTTDATPDASDAIFVWGNSSMPAGVEIGDSVRVTGRVSEFYDATQIVPSSGGVVELESPLAAVSPFAVAYPSTETAREAQEGMLLAPTDTLTVSNVYSTNQYGEVGLATGDRPLVQPTEVADDDDPAALQAVKDDNLARGVILDDGATTNYLGNQANKALPVPWLTKADGTANPIRVGAEATLVSPVILDFRNSRWKFQPRSQVTTDGATVATFEDTRADNLAPQDVLGSSGDLEIATFNVLNYFNTTGEAYVAAGPQQSPPVDTHCTYYTDRQGNRIGNNQCGVQGPGIPSPNDGRGPRGAATEASLARQEAKLTRALLALDADIVALEEVENSIKLVGETNRDDALARIARLLNDATAPGTWAYVRSPGEAVSAGAVAEQDVIRGAFLYKRATVETVGQSDILFGTSEFASAREPLAQAFKAKGAPDVDAFAVIVNHFKSKGDNRSPVPPATGDNANSPDTGAFNGDRVRQAERLLEFADDFATGHGIEAVFLAGDFNSYSKEDPIWTLEQGGFTQIESDTHGEESYSFSGLSGSLDHVFGNEAAMAMVTGADIWEINANEAISFQYSRYNYNVTDFWQPNLPFATSDHNPEIIGIDVPEFTPTTYKEIQVVGTNDFHGRLLPDGGNAAGAAPFATAIDELRSENPNTVFVAAGDLVGASTFESFIQNDVPTIDALNAMNLEVSAAGNHEFDQGYADLVGRIQDRADWEYLAANVVEPAGNDKLAETWVKEMDGVRVGFVGAVTEDLLSLVNPAGMEGVTVTDVVEATNAAAAELRSGTDGQPPVDLVILLVHEGSPTTDCGSSSFTDEVTDWGNIVQNTSADVDAIISGHTHLAYNCKYPVEEWATDGRAVTERPVVSAGQYGTNLNKLVFKYDEATGELAGISQEVVATAGVGHAPHADVQPIVDQAVAFAEVEGAKPLGRMDGPLNRARYLAEGTPTENRGGESTLSNQVAEIQRWATDQAGIETDIALMNPGGLRADMVGTAEGELRSLNYRQAADVQPFANTLVNMELTGAQLETVLEQQWQRTAQGGVPSRPFLRLGVSKGFTYTYEESPETVTVPNAAPVATFRGEVTGMWLDGVAIDPAETYSVTVNSFLAGGGDNFWELAEGSRKVDTGKVDLEAMVDYMKQYGTDPLPVDYSQRAVEVAFPADAPEAYAPGETVAFDVASWAMSAAGDRADAQVEVRLGDRVLGTVPVDNTIGNRPYDDVGTASVAVPLPESTTGGEKSLTLVGTNTGTEITVPITVDSTTDIQILGTNDFHGRLLADGSNAAGAEVLSGAVKQLRSENPNTVFAAAGDLIGASTFESFIQQDVPTIDALNEAGLEVSAAGNHEFDQGYEDLVGRVQDRADWEYIAANVVEPEGRDDLAETWTQSFGDVEVGFVGAVTEELPALVSPAGIEGVTVTDIVDATNEAAAQLRADGADIVVLLVHEGSPSTSCASPSFTDEGTVWGNITQNVSGDVDAIISGHTHLAYDCSIPVPAWVSEGRAVTERPVVSAGQYGTNLNKLVFSYDSATDQVVAKTQQVVGLTGGAFPADPAVTPIVDAAKAEAEVLGAAKLGEIEASFDRARYWGLNSSNSPAIVENRGGESTLGNLVAEVQRWATETPEAGAAQIAFMNPGGLRANMAGTVNGEVRDLTYRQAANVQPFANTLINMDLTGAQIETLLEQQWQRNAAGGVPSRPFLRLGVSEGFTYTYVETGVTVGTTETFAGEVTGMWLHGEPIDPTASYSVTANSFLAAGGDNFREFAKGAGKTDTGKVDLQAMVDYMATFAAAGSPLAVDYRQRAVEVEFPGDAPAHYVPGGTVSFDVASWSMTGALDVQDSEIQVKLGDTLLGTAGVTNGEPPGTPYDRYGTAGVSVALPDDLGEGEVELTLVGAQTGTEVIVPVSVARATPTVTATGGRLVYGKPTRVRVTVTAPGLTPTGTVTLWHGARRLGSGTLADGAVVITIPARSLPPRSAPYRLTARYGGDAAVLAGQDVTTLAVGKASPRLTTTIRPQRIVVDRTRATVVVRVGSVDGVPAQGTVSISSAGKATRTARVVDGKATVLLTKFAHRGPKRLSIRYSGSALLAPARTTETIRVVRRR
ncbi:MULTISPECIES: ExeM/NucH family extracellular endonuclease [Nocardioides]|uniref:ExeM/NucH family extracellular endonuclease n=1 Tax=Nocardioides vastitatis TaxID=2568655 RepID=A0ABW0ZP11_9ACTN|nr:ExeM/NucH family extracellular endonuclease [Nocardioides sp.]THI96492.1 ExeM/NucH family extracellular endonuclease [Nocardioides sp.]